ncbi:MAG: WD40 repeat domain-containing protein [Bacteroidales bacterium]|nr:WD40 repeat domain-containing protein [Bacteroidales bacterium]
MNKKYILLITYFIFPLFTFCQKQIIGNENKIKCIETFIGHNAEVFSVSFSPDGSKIASTSDDESIKIWDINTKKCIKNIPHAHYKASISASFSPDGKKLVSCGSDGVKIWDVNSGSCIKCIGNTGSVINVAYSPNSKRILTSNEDGRFYNTYNAYTGEELNSYTVGHNTLYSISYSPDGTKILAPTKDGTIKILNANNGKCIITLYGHNSPVISASFSQDGSRIISTAINDRNIKIWNTNTGECLQTLYGHDDKIFSVKISPNGNYIVSSSKDGTIKLWGVIE